MLVLQTYTQEHCSTYATDPGVILACPKWPTDNLGIRNVLMNLMCQS